MGGVVGMMPAELSTWYCNISNNASFK